MWADSYPSAVFDSDSTSSGVCIPYYVGVVTVEHGLVVGCHGIAVDA